MLPGDHPVADGLAVAADGRLFVTTVNGGGIDVLNADGTYDQFIEAGTIPTNCVFDGTRLLMTDAGAIADTPDASFTGQLWVIETGTEGGPTWTGSIGGQEDGHDRHDLAIPAGYARDIFDLTGRVAVVTGAGSGLGEAISIGFAQAGMTVVLADVNVAGAERVAGIIADDGATAIVKQLDVTSKEACDRVADEVVAEAGRVDVLVNSAGSAFRCPAEDFPEDKFDFIVGLNMKGTYLCCQAFGRKMLAQGKGSIINMGSIGGFIGYPLASAYLASKGAVVQITKGLALEWPRPRRAGQRHRPDADGLAPHPRRRRRPRRSPPTSSRPACCAPGWACPRELIGAAIFLASDASELVTGHMLMCDDGYLTQ